MSKLGDLYGHSQFVAIVHLGVRDACPCAEVLGGAARQGLCHAHAVLVPQFTVYHIGEDLHVAVGVSSKAGVGLQDKKGISFRMSKNYIRYSGVLNFFDATSVVGLPGKVGGGTALSGFLTTCERDAFDWHDF